jgi:hypothetical protein
MALATELDAIGTALQRRRYDAVRGCFGRIRETTAAITDELPVATELGTRP